jgi:hypothetical protein
MHIVTQCLDQILVCSLCESEIKRSDIEAHHCESVKQIEITAQKFENERTYQFDAVEATFKQEEF